MSDQETYTTCGAPQPEFTVEAMNRACREMRAIWGDTPNEIYLHPSDFRQIMAQHPPQDGPYGPCEHIRYVPGSLLRVIEDPEVKPGTMETDVERRGKYEYTMRTGKLWRRDKQA